MHSLKTIILLTLALARYEALIAYNSNETAPYTTQTSAHTPEDRAFSEPSPEENRAYETGTTQEFAQSITGTQKESVFDKLNPGGLKGPVLAAKPIEITMSGFIMNNIFWDTRQNVSFQVGDSLLYPKEVDRDPFGNDINAHGDIGIVPIETNLRFDFNGPYIGCAKTSGVIEANFFGLNDFTLNVNELTMLKAFMQLSWDHLDIVVGQTFHPLLYPANLPNTVGYSFGNPFHPFAYAPQFQFVYHFPHAEMIFAVLSEINNPSIGPIGFNEINFSHVFFKNGMMPKLHLQFRIPFNKDYVFGIGYDAKRIVPRLETNNGFKSFESVFSSTGIAYIEMHNDPWIGLLKATIGQNGIDYGMVGGYAVHSVNVETDQRTYTNFTVGGLLMDIEYNANTFQPGFFAAVLKSFGAGDSIIQEIQTPDGPEKTVYGLGENIDVMFRIAPRLRYNIPPVVVATEFEYTQARHGKLLNNGKISSNGVSAGNWRFILAMFYFF